MTENEYKADLISSLRGRGCHVQTHEDMLVRYIPDISFGGINTDVWVEVKYVPEPPKALRSIKHCTYGQIEWLEKRGAAGSGHCYLLVGMPGRHYLWKWSALGATTWRMPWGQAIRLAKCVEGSTEVMARRLLMML